MYTLCSGDPISFTYKEMALKTFRNGVNSLFMKKSNSVLMDCFYIKIFNIKKQFKQ